jgi:hypothetical protein
MVAASVYMIAHDRGAAAAEAAPVAAQAPASSAGRSLPGKVRVSSENREDNDSAMRLQQAIG